MMIRGSTAEAGFILFRRKHPDVQDQSTTDRQLSSRAFRLLLLAGVAMAFGRYPVGAFSISRRSPERVNPRSRQRRRLRTRFQSILKHVTLSVAFDPS